MRPIAYERRSRTFVRSNCAVCHISVGGYSLVIPRIVASKVCQTWMRKLDEMKWLGT